MPAPKDVHLSGVQGAAPYFGEYVKQQLIANRDLGPKRVYGEGLRVYTTIDLKLQKAAQQAIKKWLPDPNGPAAALVSIDPDTGAVLAMVGGRNFHQSQFNLAVQGERQPGSSFKPFVLAAALQEGISPQTTFKSGPVSIFLGNKYWHVHNYEGESLGVIDLTKALAASDNTVFAQLTKVVGPGNVVRAAHELGITRPLQSYFAIGLGAEPVSPLDMARAYASFANGGSRVDGLLFGNEPRTVSRIDSATGSVLYRNSPVRHRVLSSTEDAIVTQMLAGVIANGTGTAAAIPGRAVAGKTGTTENYGDAWFVGYTPHLVTAVWVGYPNTLKPMLTEFHGGPVVGGTFPALIWKTFTEAALGRLQLPAESFPSAPYIPGVAKRVAYQHGQTELDNGSCKETQLVIYFDGRGPAKTADCKLNEVDVPNVVGHTLAAAQVQLEAQPLTPETIYKPASAGQKIGRVLRQFPSGGTLSTYGKVTLVLAKPLHGLVPRVVGLTLRAARTRLEKLHLRAAVRLTSGTAGRVLSQEPSSGVAAAPGMTIRLVVGRS